MPTPTRPLEATDNATMHLVAVSRHDGVAGGIDTPPPTDFLPSSGSPAAAPTSASARTLALDALRLLPRLTDARRRPATWAHPIFGREVEVARAQLAPVRTRGALADSYRREAFHDLPGCLPDAEPGPVRIAYALRWLELGDGIVGPTWSSMVGPCG
jgi:hypothetical protein